MAWFAELAGKAEHLLNNLDQQTGEALRNQNVIKPKKRISSQSWTPAAEATWLPKKRPIPRSLRKVTNTPESSCNIVSKKSVAPVGSLPPRAKDFQNHEIKIRKSSTKPYNLNHCPKILVDNHPDAPQPQRSRPLGLVNDPRAEHLQLQMEKIEMENAMLKNELHIMSKVESDVLSKLNNAEEELYKANEKCVRMEAMCEEMKNDKEIMSSQLQELKNKITDFTGNEFHKYKIQKREMDAEKALLRDRINELEEKIARMNQSRYDQETMYLDLDNQLQHANNNICSLQKELEKSKQECKQIETDWETYKIRVKTMLAGKDKEIRTLKNGLNLSEDTRALISQIDNLKAERSMLSEAVGRVRDECDDMRQYLDTLETRHSAAERVAVALRDALRDERAARNRAETQANSLAKELKSIQIEMGQTIASLRLALRDKEQEIFRQVDSSSSNMLTTISNTLNVADYEVSRDTDTSADNDKVYSLSQKLMQRQKQVENLMADNNMMKIQMEKFERLYKNRQVRPEHVSRELRPNKAHSVVSFQSGTQTQTQSLGQALLDSSLEKLSRRIGSLTRAYPALRICIIFYMVFLQIWVVTVLYNYKIESRQTSLPNAEN